MVVSLVRADKIKELIVAQAAFMASVRFLTYMDKKLEPKLIQIIILQ